MALESKCVAKTTFSAFIDQSFCSVSSFCPGISVPTDGHFVIGVSTDNANPFIYYFFASMFCIVSLPQEYHQMQHLSFQKPIKLCFLNSVCALSLGSQTLSDLVLIPAHRLIEECWNEKPAKRPSFRQIILRLESIYNTIGHKRRWKVCSLSGFIFLE